MNGYDLTRNWFNYKFENQDKVKAIHTDFYIYLVDQWNRLGQKKSFGLPTSVTMECLGIGSYNTYKKTLNNLIEFGFVILVSESKNQHQSKIVALSKIDKALDKALDKASIKATDKALDTIDKQYNNLTKEQINNILAHANSLSKSDLNIFLDSFTTDEQNKNIDSRKLKFAHTLQEFSNIYSREMLKEFYEYWIETNDNGKKFRREMQRTWNLKRRLETWFKNENKFNTKKQSNERLNIITTEIRNYDPTI